MKKRGQVTVFIILALVIIILIAIIWATKSYVLKDRFQQEIETHKNVPLEVQPINEYLDSCTAKVTEDGINLLAIKGGYINLPRDSMPTSSFNPLSSSLEIFSNSDLRTAVWFREQPNGIFTTNVPTIMDMETSLEQYINQNYQQCLNNLTTFEEQGFSFVISDSAKSVVTIRDKTVDVKVTLPIQITKESLAFSLESHLAQIESRLGELYDMAVEILNSENRGFFLENKTIDLLVAYDPEIPFSGTTTNCNERIWSKREVSQKLKDTISQNVAAFRIKGTNYVLQDNKFEYLVFDALESSHNDITVNMLYSPKWPTNIEITPSEGDLLKEDSIARQTGSTLMGILSSFFCLTTHHFIYTIKYPVLVTLTSPDGLTFQFSTQIIVDRNYPRKNRAIIDELPDTASKLCQYPVTDVTIETYSLDSAGNIVPVNDAEIYFKCSPATCRINLAKLSNNRYRASLPACYNGILEARKEGYYNGKIIEVSTNQNIDKIIPIILIPKYKKNVKVFVIDKGTGEIRAPYDSEQVIFQFDNQARQTPYSVSFVYQLDNNQIELIPGDYAINSYVMGNSTWPITTQKQTIEHCTKVGAFMGIFGGEEKCITTEIPETKIDQAIKGGVNFKFTFNPEDLGKDSDLVLYTMASPIPGDIESMAKIYEEISLNSEDKRFRYPEI